MNSDWELLKSAKEGDNRAIATIYNKHYKSLLRISSLITGSVDTAKDIVQETFIRILDKKIKHFDGSFKAYITTVTYRLSLKEKYRLKKWLPYSSESSNDMSPIDDHIKKETNENVFQAIFTLPENQKRILILRFYASLSYEEISKITELPLGTVKSRIFYAVKACGSHLKKKGLLE